MDEICELVMRAMDSGSDRAPRQAAYGELVGRFQDMAYAYAYSILGDFHLAQDAAQEAFVQAWQDLADLREPAAFAGWLRRIVFKHCDRIRRRVHGQSTPLEAAGPVASHEPDPAVAIQHAELREAVLAAVRALSEPQREVTSLFYINGYSQDEIAAFLELPVSTVKNRLHGARQRLRERMTNMVADELRSHPLPDDFRRRVLEEAFQAGDFDRALLGMLPPKQGLATQPDQPAMSKGLLDRLTGGASWLDVLREGIGRQDLDLLLEKIPDHRGLLSSLVDLLEKYPQMARSASRTSGITLLHLATIPLIDPQDPTHERLLVSLLDKSADVNARATPGIGATPLHWATAYGNLAAMRILLDHGADMTIRVLADNDGGTPLHYAVAEHQIEAVRLLLDRGADPAAQAGGRNGGTPLNWAAARNRIDIMQELLDHGLDVNSRGRFGAIALHWAASGGHVESVRWLLQHGANVNARNGAADAPSLYRTGDTPLLWAAWNGRADVVRLLLSHGADPTLADQDGYTPLARAQEKGHADVVDILREHT